MILLGIHQMEVINLETTPKTKEHPTEEGRKSGNEFFNAFLIGVTFSLVGPLCRTSFSSVLAIAASGGDGALQGLS